MSKSTATETYRWAEHIISELTRLGVRHFFIAPGSRSAPLSMVILRLALKHASLHAHLHFDERSLAFAALGASKATEQPVVIVTSSGTAVANLLPALVEASQLNIPLIALTADRPEELINVGANQAIEQPGIFSHYVRRCIDLSPLSEVSFSQLLHEQLGDDPGPLHINAKLREPLYPSKSEVGEPRPLPLPLAIEAKKSAPIASIDITGDGCVIIAASLNCYEAKQVLSLAEQHSIPIIADATSQLRQLDHPLILHSGHFLMQHKTFDLSTISDVIQFGGRIVSKSVNQFLEKFSGRYFLIDQKTKCLDPTGKAKQIKISADKWTKALHISMRQQNRLNDKLMTLNQQIGEKLRGVICEEFSEYSCVALVSELLPSEHHLFLGNSLAIRLFDQAAVARKQSNPVYSNRGASGIDGLIATSAGLLIASDTPTTAIIGDLAALYDLNSLYWLKEIKQTYVLIILNNDGGQIFSMLPAADQRDVFQQAFEQPHGLGFEHFAKAFHVNFQCVKSLASLESAYISALSHEVATIIEIKIPSQAFKEYCTRINKVLSESRGC